MLRQALSGIKSMFTSDGPLRAARPAWILVTAFIAVSLLCQAAAAGEIKGKVVEAAGNTAKVSLDSIDAVKIGDAVEFFEFVAEIQDETQIGTSVVAMIEAGKVTVTIGQSSAKVAAGQQTRVRHVRRSPCRKRSGPGNSADHSGDERLPPSQPPALLPPRNRAKVRWEYV